MAGGGIKINNVKINGGADGATFVPSVDDNGYLSWTNDKEYPNPSPVKVKGEKGENGADGKDGSIIQKVELKGQDENGGNIYLMTFSDGRTATFIAPKGQKGEDGGIGGTIEGQLFLKTGGEGDNKFGAISSINADGTTTYLLRPYKNGDELHEVIGNSNITPEIIAKSRPIIRIGDDFNYIALKREVDEVDEKVDNLTAENIGAIPIIEQYPENANGFYIYGNDHNGNVIVKGANSGQGANQIQMTDAWGRIACASAFVTQGLKEYKAMRAGDIKIVPKHITLTEDEKASWQNWLGVGGSVEWVANTPTAIGDVEVLAVAVEFQATMNGEVSGVTLDKIYPYTGNLIHTSDTIFDGYEGFIQVFGAINYDGVFSATVNVKTTSANANGVEMRVSKVLIKK